jgi:hypothetical protein
MNRRAFLGALAAVALVPVKAFTFRSVPVFAVGFTAAGERLRFEPFSEFDWIDLPSRITGLEVLDDANLLIRCVGGLYILRHAGVAERDWFVQEVREYRSGARNY